MSSNEKSPSQSARKQKSAPGGVSRRRFIGGMGAGVGAIGAAAIGATGSALTAAPTVIYAAPATNFGRIFPDLPSFQPANDQVRNALRAVGAKGGIMDPNDAINIPNAAQQLIADPTLSVNNPDNPTHTAGTTFFGQFMDHDMTFDSTSVLGVPTDPAATQNGRRPIFDLDSVYLGGPSGSPQLYDRNDQAKLLIETVAPGSNIEDLPRAPNGMAIIGDPRNDENLMVAGIHAAVIRFHNNMVDQVRTERGIAPNANFQAVFPEAQRRTLLHYQYLILNEFLPLFIGQPMVDNILTAGPRFYNPPRDSAFMPVEFQGASYRFGHSMVRPSYRANLTGQPAGQPNAPQFFGLIFDPNLNDTPGDRDDLLGGFRAPRRFIGWTTFFNFPAFAGDLRRNKQIDTHISSPLFDLPLPAIATGDQPTALPQRNLLRQLTWSIPSGQAIAQRMGETPLSAAELADIGDVGRANGVSDLDQSTPLWFYGLREAQLRAGGLTLGPVAGRIVGEVIIGLLQSDPNSIFGPSNKGFVPTVPTIGPQFRMIDFLTFAGVGVQR